jgi:hypothetical protein
VLATLIALPEIGRGVEHRVDSLQLGGERGNVGHVSVHGLDCHSLELEARLLR